MAEPYLQILCPKREKDKFIPLWEEIDLFLIAEEEQTETMLLLSFEKREDADGVTEGL